MIRWTVQASDLPGSRRLSTDRPKVGRLARRIQRRIVSRFAGDYRGLGATYFSFKTNTPDRNFYEVGGGLAVNLPGASTGVFGGRMILSNDRYDSYTVEGSVRVPF